MSREAGQLTQAIRKLLDESNGAITHCEARQKLQEMGFQLAKEPPTKSAEFAQWDEYAVDYDDPNTIAATAAVCGFDEKTTNAVVKEAKLRAAYKAESNSFNVIKSIWNKSQKGVAKKEKGKRGRPKSVKSVAAPAAPTATPVPTVAAKRRGRPKMSDKKSVSNPTPTSNLVSPVVSSVVSSVTHNMDEVEKAINQGIVMLEQEIVRLQKNLQQVKAVKATFAA